MDTVSILIPAYNEEKSIGRCLDSCFRQTRKADEIIVVNDGSTDSTLQILKSFGNKIRIVNLKENTGNKSKAQEKGLKYVKTDFFITTDADTRLHPKFVEEIIKPLKTGKVSAVCGHVQSERNNWITKVREINYVVGQTIYKKAQSKIGALFVLAGCSSAFNTKDFRKIVKFEHDNITEDLDFTYKFKLENRRIAYSDRAVVYTQDPNNLKSYFKQLNRWYSGGWVCLRKNIQIFREPNNSLILSLIYMEGLIMGGFFVLSPLLLLISVKTFFYFILLEMMITSLSLTYGAIKYRETYLFFYIPHYYVLHIMDDFIFLKTFVDEIVLKKRQLKWHKPERY